MLIGMGIGGIGIAASPGGAQAFNPASVAGLQLWLKGDAGTLDASGNPITVDNTAIATWNDQSSNAYSAIQATALNRPFLRTGSNGINGKSVVNAQAANQLLASATGTLFTTNVTTFLVYSTPLTSGDNTYFKANNTTPTFANGDNTFFAVRRYALYANGGRFDDTSLVVSTAPTLITIKANATSGNDVVTNTTYRINRTTVPLTYAFIGPLTYGNYATALGFTAGGANCKIAEVLVYNNQLSTNNMTAVEGYLSAKWGTP